MISIDPIEALAAITGVGLVTGERSAAITEDEIKRAMSVGDRVASLVSRAMNESLDHKIPPPINTERAIKALNKTASHGDHVEMMDRFPPGYRMLAIGYGTFLSQLRNEIAKMVPRQVSQTLVGPQINPAPAYQMAKFLSVLQVIDDPLQAIRGIGAGSLTKKQAAAVKLVYPTLSALITTAITAAASMKLGGNTREPWQPTWKLNNGLAAWFETTPISQPLLQRMQEAHLRFAERKAQSMRPPGAPKDKAPSDKVQFDTPR